MADKYKQYLCACIVKKADHGAVPFWQCGHHIHPSRPTGPSDEITRDKAKQWAESHKI